MKNEIQFEIQDLAADVGVELSAEELQAVSGARMSVTWTCGSGNRADEWLVS